MQRRGMSLALPAAGLIAAALCVGNAHAQVTVEPIASVGASANNLPWEIEFVPADPRAQMPAHCRATRVTGNRSGVRIIFGEGISALDFNETGALQPGDSYEVQYWFGRDAANASDGTARRVRDNEGADWMRIEEPADPGVHMVFDHGEINTLSVRVKGGRQTWTFPTTGGDQIIEPLTKCHEERVAKAQPPAQPAAPPQISRLPRPSAPPPMAQVQPPASPQPRARQADCLMTIRGRNYIDGRCQFESDPDGSFRAFGERWFAYVNIIGPGLADASWNGNPPAQSAQERIGELRRNGACWENRDARICAWGLGERPQRQAAPPPPPMMQAAPPPPRVVQAAPPPPAARRPAPGKSFYVKAEGADVPALGVDISGGQIREGTPIMLWQCHQQAPQRFGVIAATSRVFVTAAQHLCIDGNDRQQLRLVHCEAVRRNWRYDPRTDTIRSNDGLCWDISGGNVPDNIRQRRPVVAWRCHNGINQQFVLND